MMNGRSKNFGNLDFHGKCFNTNSITLQPGIQNENLRFPIVKFVQTKLSLP